MKIRLLVWIGELLLGEKFSGDGHRADMFLPIWLLAFSIVLLVAGAVAGIYAAIKLSLIALVAAVALAALGVAALLCWRNQTIRMLSDDYFEYTTFLGKKTVYRFSDIKGLKKNNDSMTLFVADRKVHIEACAKTTVRLLDRINRQLEVIYGSGQ